MNRIHEGASRGLALFYIKRFLGTFGLCLVITLGACVPMDRSILTPLPSVAPTGSTDFIKEVVLAQDARPPKYEPIGVTAIFTPNQEKIFVVVTVADAPRGSKVKAVWYAVDVGPVAAPNTKLTESTSDAEGNNNLAFWMFTNTPPWHEGTYRVEIYANDRLVRSVDFGVIGFAAPNADVIASAVLAKGARENTLEPIEPTNAFGVKEKTIHLIVSIQNAPPQTEFRAVWFFGSAEVARSALKSDGTRNLAFLYDHGAKDFDAGDYHVELYMNGQLNRTLAFSVK